ncbi:urease accessory protein UreE [Candidatus Poribacteria bacterium]|nr:urease accessory protein UreE [Candidatus Poribacteria bacterium]
MIIVEKIVTTQNELSPSEHDIVSLDWEARQKCRQRLRTKAGREIGLALPTGTRLSPGDVLYRDSDVEIIVEGEPEKVFALRPKKRGTFGLICYQIGNLHRPIGFENGAILVPYEPVLEKQLTRLGFTYTVEERIFTGVLQQSQSHAHVH